MDPSKTITLVSSDGEKIQVSAKAAQRSVLIKGIIEDYPDDAEVPLNNVKKEILKKVVEYLEHYKDEEPKEIPKNLTNVYKENVSEFDFNFINVDLDMNFEILSAAFYLDIKSLIDLAASKIGSIIKGKAPETIRQTFQIPETSDNEKKDIEKECETAMTML